MEKYRPSNGTEGDYFISKYCMNCVHCDPDPEGQTQCEIIMLTMIYDVTDEDYPNEWVYVDGKPTCTKWQPDNN